MKPQPTIRLEPSSPIPPYEQVRQQVADLITAGVLATGDRLPPVRQLALDLGLSPGAIARSYQELEAAGLIITNRGGGTHVAHAPVLTKRARTQALTMLASAYVAAARRIGASNEDLLAAINETI